MKKRRFNHIEPREPREIEPGEIAGTQDAPAPSFRRALERGLRVPAVIRAFLFRRKIEVTGREREPDPVADETPAEKIPEKKPPLPEASHAPSGLHLEEPAKPAPLKYGNRQAPPRDFRKTKSELEKLASEIKDFEPPVSAPRRTAGQLKKDELERMRKRDAEIADLVHRDSQPARTPSKASAIAKILLGSFVLLLFTSPFLFFLFPGLGGAVFRAVSAVFGESIEYLVYIIIGFIAVVGTLARRRYRR